MTNRVASSGSAPMASPTTKATGKKMLKLNANGKLLSSPGGASSTSKSKVRKEEKKNDKRTRTKRIVIKYGIDQEGRSRIGTKINEVLNKPNMSQNALLLQNDAPPKTTHPFFLGKLSQNLESNAGAGPGDVPSKDQLSEKPSSLHTAVAWKDIIFTSQKPIFAKNMDSTGAPWPSNDIQHLGADVKEALPTHHLKLRGAAVYKSKEQHTQITSEEDVIHSKCRYDSASGTFSDLRTDFSDFLQAEAKSRLDTIHLPQRVIATGQQILAMLDGSAMSIPNENTAPTSLHAAIGRVRSLLPTSFTAFDQGKPCNGSAWTVQYAPCSANDVLQPAASELRDWMKSLTTSVTQKIPPSLGGKNAQASKKTSRKKKRRKVSEEFDGFIASSDDEAEGEHDSNLKNAVLISGPPGCGKTASVFAVAKELDFEVFEVHPGMRRSAKDIFDKVGDMTHNHLVQGAGDGIALEPDSSIIDTNSVNEDIASGKQGTMNKFFSSKTSTGKQRRSPRKLSSKVVENVKAPKAQKQSVILLEEVDILFDEDRGFWTGVVGLISQSKRPVVFTCNDESSVPFDDLPLHAIWRYQPPAPDLASEYLMALAANEGHILDKDSVTTLYRSKGDDLRATITELDFWCQMGIGSQKSGLDWMLDHSSTDGQTATNGRSLRVFSKDTYTSGIGLALPSQVPREQRQEALLSHARDHLRIPVVDWQDASDVLHTESSSTKDIKPSKKQIDDLHWAAKLLDARSDLDLFDDTLTAALSVRIATALMPNKAPIQEVDVVRTYFAASEHNGLSRDDLLSALEPMTVEKPTFPPALGRLAPSLEGPTSTIATDIAPYIRSIVAFDQRLEQQREAMTGDLQGKKVRKTRAARAALEGGSKANTRRERWFPAMTDFEKVMNTAGKGWP